MEKPIQQKQKVGIMTSLNNTTLTKVTYGKYATRVPDEVAYGIYEWFSSQLTPRSQKWRLDAPRGPRGCNRNHTPRQKNTQATSTTRNPATSPRRQAP